MLYVHGKVSQGRGIDINYPPIHWSVKSFVIFEGLTYMAANYIHSHMTG